MKTLSILAAFWLMASPCQAQSFNCLRAKTATEVAICQSVGLRTMDERLAYAWSLLTPHRQRTIIPSQADWLRSRKACGYNHLCIAKSYEDRLDYLVWVIAYE